MSMIVREAMAVAKLPPQRPQARKTMMTSGRFAAAVVAIAANGAALATVHGAMGEIVEHEKAALTRPARVVVVGHRVEQVAIDHCPSPKVL